MRSWWQVNTSVLIMYSCKHISMFFVIHEVSNALFSSLTSNFVVAATTKFEVKDENNTLRTSCYVHRTSCSVISKVCHRKPVAHLADDRTPLCALWAEYNLNGWYYTLFQQRVKSVYLLSFYLFNFCHLIYLLTDMTFIYFHLIYLIFVNLFTHRYDCTYQH